MTDPDRLEEPPPRHLQAVPHTHLWGRHDRPSPIPLLICRCGKIITALDWMHLRGSDDAGQIEP